MGSVLRTIVGATVIATAATAAFAQTPLPPAPVVVTEGEVARVVHAISSVLDGYRELPALLKDAGSRLGEQFLRGWKF